MASQPLLSVIVPTYRRERQLAACLGALGELAGETVTHEVIIVDDGSEQPPQRVVAAAADRLSVRLLCRPHRGPAAARNAGAAEARGRYLVFLDDDCLPARDWLTALAARITSAPDCALAGRTVNLCPRDLCAETSQLMVDYLHQFHQRSDGSTSFGTSNNLALPAAAFRAVGGFDETFVLAAGEDRDLCARLDEQGIRLVFANDVVVYHDHALTLGAFIRQQFNYGAGGYAFRRSLARRGGRSLRLESPAFYTGLVTHPCSRSVTPRAVASSALGALAQLAVAAGFVWARAFSAPGRSNRR